MGVAATSFKRTVPPRRRAGWWVLLVALLAVAQSLLVWLTIKYEAGHDQERVENTATVLASELKQRLDDTAQRIEAFAEAGTAADDWHASATSLLLAQHELLRIERRGASLHVRQSADTPFSGHLFTRLPRDQLDVETQSACAAAGRAGSPTYSASYFVPFPDGLGVEVMDLCTPERVDGVTVGFVVATMSLSDLLTSLEGPELSRGQEISFVEGDGTRLAGAGPGHGAGVFVADRVVDAPGHVLQLHVDSVAHRPELIPNLSTALVLGLSLGLSGVVFVLARDVRRRARVEAALAESLALRKAMEDSVVTGLRACDLAGRVTHVNHAFCALVGYEAGELLGRGEEPYWPQVPVPRPAPAAARGGAEVEGFEASFVRRDGTRFPVMVYEAPLLDGDGVQTGWMGTVLDLSAQRRVERIARQQQERLQATARLATIGEMASLLSHELNQPLSAIASYAAGSSNLLDEAGGVDKQLLRQAIQRIAEQAERAGRIIKSVHDFARRREHVREAVAADQLIDAVLPLIRLQAGRRGATVRVVVPTPAPVVSCDRTMIEQVVLNLARNGLQAMEALADAGRAELTLSARQSDPRWVEIAVTDHGPGVTAEVGAQLFTPFFTTRHEGLGLGLSLCRTVVEQHGGALEYENLSDGTGGIVGAEFRFTLPIALMVAGSAQLAQVEAHTP